jgi:hypothetical protein
MEVSDQLHALAALPKGKSPGFPLDRRLDARFTTLWRSEIHIDLKIDADALNRYRRRFCVRRTIYHIIMDSEGSMLVRAHALTVCEE